MPTADDLVEQAWVIAEKAGHPIPRQVVKAMIDNAYTTIQAELYEKLGNDHRVTFTNEGWAIEHSVSCRLGGSMINCRYHAAIATSVGKYGLGPPGTWVIMDVDTDPPALASEEDQT